MARDETHYRGIHPDALPRHADQAILENDVKFESLNDRTENLAKRLEDLEIRARNVLHRITGPRATVGQIKAARPSQSILERRLGRMEETAADLESSLEGIEEFL